MNHEGYKSNIAPINSMVVAEVVVMVMVFIVDMCNLIYAHMNHFRLHYAIIGFPRNHAVCFKIPITIEQTRNSMANGITCKLTEAQKFLILNCEISVSTLLEKPK